MTALLIRKAFTASLILLLIGLTGIASASDCDKGTAVARLVSLQGTVSIDGDPARLHALICRGDTIQVGQYSGANILLFDTETIVSIDQQSQLIVLAPPEANHSILDLLRGAIYLFSRDPRALNVDTPHVNALVEGTEFVVTVTAARTSISVFEGRVGATNDKGKLAVNSGRTVISQQGKKPEFIDFVRPENSVQWALHYRPVLEALYKPITASVKLRQAIGTPDYSNIVQLLDQLEIVPLSRRDEEYYIFRAALLMSSGQADVAKEHIRQALQLDPENGNAQALLAIIAVTRNEYAYALELANNGVTRKDDSAVAWLALSYAQQSVFKIDEALESAETAVKLDPENALLLARLAELWLSKGELDQARVIAEQAVSISPTLARTQSVLGFANLARIDIKAASDNFSRAIELDSTDPLPQLGLGLANIRQGLLARGREKIAIAVSLDPLNSLYRSYLGKAYFEEQRVGLAKSQYDIAEQLDPNDPTPWFYDAIRLQLGNRSVEALDTLEKSIDLNDNRGVYRSRLLLDKDLATRGTSLARIYTDLGFSLLGVNEATHALSIDPSNPAAHRFLADLYVGKPRFEVARVSELLQAQLLQPVGHNPVQSSLAFTDLNMVAHSGPADAGFNEFTPMFIQNGLQLDLAAIAGTDDTFGNEFAVTSLAGRSSLSFSQYHYETDGFRSNNDLAHDIYTLFGQMDFTTNLSLQSEYRYRNSESGDRGLNFNLDDFRRNFRVGTEEEVIRVGGRFSPSSSEIVLVSAIRTNRERAETLVIPLIGSLDQVLDTDVYQLESQYFRSIGFLHVVGGVGWAVADNTFHRSQSGMELPDFEIETSAMDVYLSGSFAADTKLDLTGRLGYTKVEVEEHQSGIFDEHGKDGLTPALGAIWQPTENLRLRAGLGRSIKRPFVANQTIKSTHHAGFNEQFDDFDATRSDWLGVAADVHPSQSIRVGAAFLGRRLAREVSDGSNRYNETQIEYLLSAYLNATPSDRISLSLELNFEDFSAKERDNPSILDMQTLIIPLSIVYMAQHRWSASASASLIEQDVNQALDGRLESNEILVDVAAGYRLPGLRGVVGLKITNLFDRAISFQDEGFRTSSGIINGANPRFSPSRKFLATITLNF